MTTPAPMPEPKMPELPEPDAYVSQLDEGQVVFRPRTSLNARGMTGLYTAASVRAILARACAATQQTTTERQPDPSQQWKCGDEWLPFHPAASHVPADYRDGWNRAYWTATARFSHPPQAAAGWWRDIASAPKDGREVLLAVRLRAGIRNGLLVGHYMGGGHCIEDHPPIAAGWYFWNGCMFDKAAEPTHWMPLPPSPTPEDGAPE